MELFDERYYVYRSDRNYTIRGDTMGGGVLIAIKRELKVTSVECIPSTDSIADIIRVSISFELYSRCNIYCCYFPQCPGHKDILSNFYEYISDEVLSYPDDYFLVLGDFNIPNAEWTTACQGDLTLTGDFSSDIVNELANFLSFNNFRQYNKFKNVNSRILDLLITNITCKVGLVSNPVVKEDMHHPAFEFIVETLRAKSSGGQSHSIKLYREADYEAINECLSRVDWESQLNGDSIDVSVANFYKILHGIIDMHVPTKNTKLNIKYPLWYNRALIKIIKEKLKYHCKWKVYEQVKDYRSFASLRDRQKIMEDYCYNRYISNIEYRIGINSKHFWSYVKSKRKSNDLPDIMFLGDFTTSDPVQMCDLFGSFFCSAFQPMTLNNNARTYASSQLVNINSVTFTIKQVSGYLKHLDVNKSAGPDAIPPVFLQRCYQKLAEPLAILFSRSMKLGTMPLDWKKSFVTPVYKSGNKHDISNYRPISKLSAIPKLFERIIYDTFSQIVRPFIIPEQHGFVARKSTESNLCEFLDYLYTSMDNRLQVDAVYTDYSKAFDKICHNILIHKLEQFGVRRFAPMVLLIS